ncbi:MAG: [FeFe] hydrogenase, group A [Planctomycetaceae bacterium]|jgi:NADH-quinone oxidoreductase subunit G|nr:[FeFe] hydrogenase, group A [Planctomycetaceae bacterium]
MSETVKTLTINGTKIQINNERNLLEVARKSGIEIPTFCYHSELSIYGACRLCLVEVKGLGIVASCSTKPQDGMEVLTHTEEIREIRKIALELILANHDQNCTLCSKNTRCKLQSLARKHGINDIRFKRTFVRKPVDYSSYSLVRDPNKCILCGDCVRACNEIQGVGAIGFAGRGAKSTVVPPFNKNLADVECVNCGLCATVCPVGALTVRDDVDKVWKAINDPTKKVVVQIAPAVRVAIGEAFGGQPGSIEIGRIVAALKAIGFDRVYDTSFAADQTIFEEATEFVQRKVKGENLPQFTSCCPAWVKFAEQFLPDLLHNLSTCRSPQQMFGPTARLILPKELDVKQEDLVVVSIMPCTAKKFECKQEKFINNGIADVDHVLTTQELIRMIDEAGLKFSELEPTDPDEPFNSYTGGGVIFGTTGGVMEAALRFAVEKISGKKLEQFEFKEVRGENAIKEADFNVNGLNVSVCVVYGLNNARKVADWIRKGEKKYDFVEVMACPLGCVGGAGQPVTNNMQTRIARASGLYKSDNSLKLHNPQDNKELTECYKNYFEGEIGGHTAHHLLHTTYQNRRRINGITLPIFNTGSNAKVNITVCIGTSCFAKGSQELLKNIEDFIQAESISDMLQVEATFCTENCDKGPTVVIGNKKIFHATLELVTKEIKEQLNPVSIQ